MDKELKEEIIDSISETTKTMLIFSKYLVQLMRIHYVHVDENLFEKAKNLSKTNLELVNKLKEN